VRHYRREYDRAIEIGKRAVELNPAFSHGHQLLALSYAATGKAKEAIAESDAAIALTEDRAIRLRYRAVMLSLLPAYASETRTVVRELESLSQYRQAGYIVIIYAGLRDRDRMYYWADRALRLRDGALHMAVISPQLDPFRHEPRFRELQKQLGYSR
jgi:tetratricopeptide (TPR) repeat protein